MEGWTLLGLASLAHAEGDAETALCLLRDSLAIWDELEEKGRAGETLVALGEIELEQGRHESAVEHLEEALALPQGAQEPGRILLGAVHRARLPSGDTDAALSALQEHEQRVPHNAKLDARYHLWKLTNDKTHLTEAKRLLDFAVEHSPEEYRTSMLENVPLHRDIMRAWEEHGGG
jgi:tetratricopeptide (TPR) repeat protein